MSGPETEIPFAIPLSSIVEQLGDQERLTNQDFIELVIEPAVLHAVHLNPIAEFNDSHEGRVHAVRNIVQILSVGGYLEEKVNQALNNKALFHDWSDGDKRLLVDESLTTLIQGNEDYLHRQRQLRWYYGRTNSVSHAESEMKVKSEVRKWEGLREALGQRAYPSPSAFRK